MRGAVAVALQDYGGARSGSGHMETTPGPASTYNLVDAYNSFLGSLVRCEICRRHPRVQRSEDNRSLTFSKF